MPILTTLTDERLFENYERREVYSPASGRDLSDRRYYRQPLDLVRVNGDQYVEPRYIGNNMHGFVQDDIEREERVVMSRQEGYFYEDLVIENHMFGAVPQSDDAGWFGCHRFGNL